MMLIKLIRFWSAILPFEIYSRDMLLGLGRVDNKSISLSWLALAIKINFLSAHHLLKLHVGQMIFEFIGIQYQVISS